MTSRRSGQIKKRGARKWLVSVFVGREPNGRRLYKAQTVHGTKRDADRALAEILRKRDAGTLLAPERLTVGEYLDRWLETAARPRVGPRTFQDRKSTRLNSSHRL